MKKQIKFATLALVGDRGMRKFLADMLKQLDFKQSFADVLKQTGAPKRSYKKLEQKWIFAKDERAIVTRKLWLRVMFQGQWRCKRCGIQNWKNREYGKPKMQVDHINPIFHYGESKESNLQVLCAVCNKKKGVRE